MPKKIVVIDDEPDILRVLTFRLKVLGCEILAAATGKGGLDLITAHKPDLIMVDYRLPDMDGLEIARKVRDTESVKDVPILLVSASSGEDMHTLIKDSGVTDYVLKPFDPMKLLETVKKYL
jgi:CheY-like chemotaxis protein